MGQMEWLEWHGLQGTTQCALESTFAVNVFSYMYVATAALPHLEQSRGIIVSSATGIQLVVDSVDFDGQLQSAILVLIVSADATTPLATPTPIPSLQVDFAEYATSAVALSCTCACFHINCFCFCFCQLSPGKIGMPFVALYSSTKHTLHGFFDSLRHELMLRRVDVAITLCPRQHRHLQEQRKCT